MIARSSPRMLLLALLACLVWSKPVMAQDTGRLTLDNTKLDDSLKPIPAMFSAISDGAVAYAREWALRTPGRLFVLPAGVYDIRVEGEGIVTEVKRGIQVFAGRDQGVVFNFKAGEGLHMVEYSTGGLAREEVAAQLSYLRGAVDELKNVTGMADIPDPDGVDPCCDVTAIDAELGLVTAIDIATGRTFQFQLPDKSMLADVQMGARVWTDATGKVGFKPGAPCCEIISRP